MAGSFLDLATTSVIAAVMLLLLSASLFHVASSAPAPHAVRLWGQSCLVATVGFALKSMEPAGEPAALQAFGDLLLGAVVILQGAALSQYTRLGDRIVRTLVVYNVIHLLSTIQFTSLDPSPLIRVICTDVIGAAALFSVAFLVWRPSRKEFSRLGQVIAFTYSVTGAILLLQAGGSWHQDSLAPTDLTAWSYLLAALLQVFLPLVLLTVSYTRLAGQLARSALLDPLTQARNRRGLVEAWSLLQARARRGDEGWHVGVILMDIDLFRKINQVHGYAAGDTVLQLVVESMRHTARRYDTVSRFGGEEFCMLLPGVTIRQAQVVTERVRKHFAELVKERAGIEVTLSAGITVANAGQTGMEQALDAADQMLYFAKREGRDRSRVDPDAVRVISGMAPLPRTGQQDELGFPLV